MLDHLHFLDFLKMGHRSLFFHRKIAQMPRYFSQDPQFMPKNRGMNVKLMYMPKKIQLVIGKQA